jgi:MiaB-like tRNA modifying enzyme
MKTFIKTYGCSANQNDSEIMAALLKKKGTTLVNSIEKADIVLVNTCAVKGKTESQIANYLRKTWKDYPDKKFIIAGCLPFVRKGLVKSIVKKSALVSPHQIEEIGLVIEEVKNNKFLEHLDKTYSAKANMPKLRINPLINIVQINEGCAGFCSFCITKLAKKRLYSALEKDIIEDIEKSIKNGCKEIWLTSQDTGAYGKDNKNNLADLLKRIAKIKGNFYIRIGMINPDNVKPILRELIEIYKNSKIFKFLHMPIQSGNNAILRKMNRNYSVKDCENIIKKFRKNIPSLTLSTDIICGFPGETEKQFDDSVRLIKKIKPDIVNISRFWARPGTEAALMPNQINGAITKKRSTKLAEIQHEIALEKNKKWIGWKGKVLIDEKGKNKTWKGRNFAYKQVIVKSPRNLFGKKIKTKIVDASPVDLKAE